ncbi:hypothetical protein SAMN05443633_102260 [Chryseobacterium arachidis]|uniref:Uncharacterized protein n=1 Tax=Chryseobacterium arachidis TaxID=1416778 RepID=A0A1M4X8S5_9FLAO|nr:hypothetical protein [Chryseobacterium arachidis]SHE89805.1 hypothetical protein SAMN05443633_102260 [Chryseobacterium arachidis]
MNCRDIVKKLESEHFTTIKNQGSWFEEGSVMYTKEIKENIFLLFILLKDLKTESIRALIARFDEAENIGKKEPQQIMFYLSIKCIEDLHYFEKYLKATTDELAAF